MMSFNVATEEYISRAKKGVIEIVKALKAYGCFDPSVFFKLLDAQIVPSLLYASELWGFEENKRIEQVHLYACKLFLNVPTRTPNDMIYGDLGRYPLWVDSAARCIQYWLKLLKQNNFRYSKMAYLALLNMTERGRVNWVTKVKVLLCDNGFGLVWLFGQVSNEKQFIRAFKERLQSNFSHRWFVHTQESMRYNPYNSFKDCIGCELYVGTIKVKIYRTAFTRLRMGMSPFNTHRHRYSPNEDNRNCPMCPGELDDELHVIFHCP